MNPASMNNDTKSGGNATGTGSAAATGKKAVHVKWAGKTIALGTFPSTEADEKCARAKALTRAWRSTMRPKPTREWVMQELERLGVRVVSGRLGRKAGDEDDTPSSKKSSGGAAVVPPPTMQNRKDSLGMGFGTDLDNLMQQRRNSSLGLSMLSDDMNHRRSSLGSLGPSLGLDGGNGGEPPHRPYVGGGAGAAFEAARDDHYARKREEQRRASGLGLGGMGGGPSNIPQMGLSVNPNQHYEMLKLHHMNLLNEIQETTLMMNLYQQQQLQQQQQQLQRQQANDNSGGSGGNDQMSMMMQQNGPNGSMEGMYNSGGMNQGGSHGMNPMGGNTMGMGNHHQQQMIQQQGGSTGGNASSTSVGNDGNRNGASNNVQDQLLKSQEEQKALEDQLRKLKDEITKSKKEAKELKKLAGEKEDDEDGTGSKRKAEKETDSAVKKIKSED